MQSRSITRAFTPIVGVLVALSGIAGVHVTAQDQPALSAAAAQPPEGWREQPAYLALLVPRAYRDSYRVFTSPRPLDTTVSAVSRDAAAENVRVPGAWLAHPENPLDAFGSGGTYDRWKMSRLYGSRRPIVARGPRGHSGIVDESWTLISPYPSPELDRLEPGTLLLVLRIP